MSRKAELMPVESQAVQVTEPAATSILSVIERAARSADVDVDKMERLFALQERFLAKEAETAFNAAMSRVQSKIGRVAANQRNDQTRSRYADYAAIDRECRPVYVDEGFSVSFGTEDSPKPEHIRVMAYVSHQAGHTRMYHVDMPADGKGAKGGDVMTKTHAAGSATAYGMRYLLKMIWNIAIGEDDTDGNTEPQRREAPQAPADYEDWKADMGALADEGLQPLQAGWARSAPDLRQYASMVDKAWWDATKAKARQVPA